MLLDQNLGSYLWAEASCTAVYIQNISPHSHLREKTPEELFSKVKPNISHLRIFRCPVCIHIPKEKITKLEPSGRKGIFSSIVKPLKHIEFTYLVKRTLNLVGM